MSEQNHVGWHKVSKERRKAIAARYYQRHRKIIKLAMTLDIPMKEARAIYAREVVCTVRKTASESMASPIGDCRFQWREKEQREKACCCERASRWAQCVPPHVIDLGVLHQKRKGISRTYMHHNYTAEKRDAVETWR
jgi:hypothetical protein